MRLADFIEQRLPDILAEWERFAATLQPAAKDLSSLGLRDHAGEILHAIATDLRTAQTARHQQDKSWGLRDAAHSVTPKTASEVHASLRASGGFSVQQLVSEYRALRASVLKLYAEAFEDGEHTLEDVGRFNEAVDQAVAESIQFFTAQVDHWRNVFLSVLQHDLRGPLHAMMTISQVIATLPPGPQRDEAIVRQRRSSERMASLLDELLDYNRAMLHLGLTVKRVPCELASPCREEVELRRLAHPGHVIDWSIHGTTRGMWDASRIKQALGNLISNAAHHGTDTGRISVDLRGESEEVLLVVSNTGSDIPSEKAASIFDPLLRSPDLHADNHKHLGLGLFIVREIAQAHDGDVTVESKQGTTRFTLRLPRPTASCI